MRVICAWCKKIIKDDDGSGLPDSHGICPGCQEQYYPEFRPPREPMGPPAPLREKTDEL